MSDKMVNARGLTEEEFLRQYDPDKYATSNPALTVDMLLFTLMDDEEPETTQAPSKHMRVLMIKRGDHPFMGKWALPGGFVVRNEDVEEAARRELMEETGIDNVYMEQLYTWGAPGRDPRTHVVSVSYMALVDSSKLRVNAGSDASDARWFKINLEILDKKRSTVENGFTTEVKYWLTLSDDEQELYGVVEVIKSMENGVVRTKYRLIERQGIAFDHAIIITYGLLKLRREVWLTPVVFSIMPRYFTMVQLKKAYEAILGTALGMDDFAAKILRTSGMVIEAKKDGYTYSDSDNLYMLNPEWDCDDII